MFAKMRILIENIPRSMAMPEGTGTFAVWAHNRFLAYDRPKYYCKWGSPKCAHRIVVVFYAIGIFWLLYWPINRFDILTAAEGR